MGSCNTLYKVKIQNNSNSPISEVFITPYIPRDIFIFDNEDKIIPLIKMDESITKTFEFRPKGECGNVKISGKVKYYDTKNDQYEEIRIPPKTTVIICPMLRAKPINENMWRSTITNLISVQEILEDISLSCNDLYDIVTDVIKDINMHIVSEDKREIAGCRLICKFYSEGVKGYKYAVQIEAIGGLKNSKLILKSFAENQESLIGFHHKILDEIDERINIKQYINDPLIIKGDYIQGGQKIEVKDSVIHRSGIGIKREADVESKRIHWDAEFE